MTTPTTRSRPVPARTLKSPLAAPGKTVQADAVTAASDLSASVPSPLSNRESTLAEFGGYLRTAGLTCPPTRRRQSGSSESDAR